MNRSLRNLISLAIAIGALVLGAYNVARAASNLARRVAAAPTTIRGLEISRTRGLSHEDFRSPGQSTQQFDAEDSSDDDARINDDSQGTGKTEMDEDSQGEDNSQVGEDSQGEDSEDSGGAPQLHHKSGSDSGSSSHDSSDSGNSDDQGDDNSGD